MFAVYYLLVVVSVYYCLLLVAVYVYYWLFLFMAAFLAVTGCCIWLLLVFAVAVTGFLFLKQLHFCDSDDEGNLY